MPSNRGFAQTFALLNGGASHWPDQAALIPGSTTRYVSNGMPVEKLPDHFYSSKDYTDRMIEFIGLKPHDQHPFFAYLSYTAPHNPLHVPAEYIEKYRGRYDMGWDDIAQQRVIRLKELDLLADSHTPAARPQWIQAWKDLTAEQQASRARDMEVYAGMIDYMDAQIGRLLDYLRTIGEYDNTLIVFISDNGPSRTTILDYLALGGKATEFFGQFDNSLANKGLPTIFNRHRSWVGLCRGHAIAIIQGLRRPRRYSSTCDRQASGPNAEWWLQAQGADTRDGPYADVP